LIIYRRRLGDHYLDVRTKYTDGSCDHGPISLIFILERDQSPDITRSLYADTCDLRVT